MDGQREKHLNPSTLKYEKCGRSDCVKMQGKKDLHSLKEYKSYI